MITQQELKKLLEYDPNTGVFIWIKPRCVRLKPGHAAGTIASNGYINIKIINKTYKAHRLAWLYMTGKEPCGEIDHKDGIGINNKWENLRDVSHSENLQNIKKAYRSNKSSGLLGVTWVSGREKWQAAISISSKKKFLGYFDNPQEAHCAYLKAKRAMGCCPN